MRWTNWSFAGESRRAWRSLAIAALVLSVPLSGPVINAHLVEHEEEANRQRALTPQHEHRGDHFEAGPRILDAAYCPYCLASHGNGLPHEAAAFAGLPLPGSMSVAVPDDGPRPSTPGGPGAPRAPPAHPSSR